MNDNNHNYKLAGLPDRSYLWPLLNDILKQVHRNRTNCGVLLINITNMKDIEEQLGEKGARDFINVISSRIEKSLWDLDKAVKFSNSQFVIIANSIQNPEDIHIVMKKIHSYLTLECEINGLTVKPDVRIGIVLLPQDAMTADDVIANAEMALLVSNPDEGKPYSYYNKDLGDRIEEHEVIKDSILSTLAKESFILHLQPKIDCQTNKVCGVEALVRMRDLEGNIVKPNEFIPVAENSNLILKVGEWVLYKARELSLEWKKLGINLPVSVNISDVQFKNGAALLSLLHKLKSDNETNSGNIILEISENIITNDVTLASALLQEIQSYGYQISLDGFGAGYSSLAVLKDLKIDEIKIDRHFMKDIPADAKNTALLNAMVILGKSMNFRVVVLGVETKEQFEIIKELECDEFQGFLISEPINSDDFLKWYDNYKVLSR